MRIKLLLTKILPILSALTSNFHNVVYCKIEFLIICKGTWDQNVQSLYHEKSHCDV